MGDVKQAVLTAATTLAVIWLLNQFTQTRALVRTALNGQ